ncbi:MAG: type II secretion system protein GspL [Betaproteobacteria bacterium]
MMTTLRVLLAAPPSAEAAVPWALFDADGRVVRSGRDVPAAWPGAARVEAVVAASRVRIAVIALPPLPAAKLASAAAYALEDQVAGPSADHHLAVSSQRADGRVHVAIVDRALLGGLAEVRRGVRFGRIVAEPELAAPFAGWRWCADGDRAFVRGPDGNAFAADPPRHDAPLPAELPLALAADARASDRMPVVRVHAEVTDADLARWQRDCGATFVRGAPWQWHTATPAAFAAATDLLQGEFAAAAPRSRGDRLRPFRVAAILAVAALTLHVVATAGEWAWRKADGWRASTAWTELATAAGVPAAQADSPASARVELARRHAELRHAQGLPSADDALPLLARAAPALAALPSGTIRSATYADGHWTLDLIRPDDAAIRVFDARMRDAGLPALTATTAAGTRVRFGAF